MVGASILAGTLGAMMGRKYGKDDYGCLTSAMRSEVGVVKLIGAESWVRTCSEPLILTLLGEMPMKSVENPVIQFGGGA